MIEVMGRAFVALRTEKSAAPVYHAVTPHCRPALCGIEPGASSQWAEPPAAHVTCPVCLQRLSRLAKPAALAAATDECPRTRRR